MFYIIIGEVYRAAMGIADEAAAGVSPDAERKARMAVVVERTEAFMSRNSEAESLCDPLYGKVAELLKFEVGHGSVTPYDYALQDSLRSWNIASSDHRIRYNHDSARV